MPLERHSPMPSGDKPLQRHTRLRTETGLRSTTPILRAKDLSPDGPRRFSSIDPKPKPRSAAEKRARRLVFARAGGVCEVARDGCQLVATDYQHRKRRPHCRKGEYWSPAAAVACCRRCHDWIGSVAGRLIAQEHGWHLDSWQSTADTPVLIGGRWWLLDDNGDKTPYEPTKRSAS